MKRWSRIVFIGLCLLAASWAGAAEFSSALEEKLTTVKPDDFISSIVILPSAVDMRALDNALHARKATVAERNAEVISALKYNAAQNQPAFLSELDVMTRDGVVKGYTPYWIDNLVVIYAQAQYLESLRIRGDIEFVTTNFSPELIDPLRIPEKGADMRAPHNPLDTETTTPGQNAIGATRVNRELGITGQGVLVANCDTGVDGTHPALSARWRGNFAPVSECWRDAAGLGHATPQDGNGHGTHVMGTMAGRAISGVDTNTVGSAPNARWIATNTINQGTGSNFDNDVIADYQWFANPDGNINTTADLPDVIQNSWGVHSGFAGYSQCDTRWNSFILNCEAAGPVVTWSAGNEASSGLRTPAIHSMSAYQIFSVGAVDAQDGAAPYPIASFSSLGPTPCTPASPDNIKPEISAPGVNIYSSVPGGGYSGTYSGTSMAGPHVAGVVALMREACPDCDHITIKDAIMTTALDQGTVGQDNTYGHGVIQAYEAVLAVSNLGRIGGVVTDGASPLSGVKAYIASAGAQTLTDVSGQYYIALSEGTYSVEYSKFGYVTQTIGGLTVVIDDTTVQNVTLSLAATGILSGVVTDCFGAPAVGATVELLNVPVAPTTTNGSGFYSFTIPQGTYDVQASGAGCGEATVAGVVVTANTTQNITLPSDPAYDCSAPDAGGYSACENGDATGPVFNWFEVAPSAGGPGTATTITLDDAGQSVALPFTYRHYGVDYNSVWICSNGYVNLGGTSTAYDNEALPSATIGAAVVAFWDDLYPPDGGQIAYYHNAAENAFIIEWYQISHFPSGSNSPETFQIWLYNAATNPGPNGDSQVRIQYQTTSNITSNSVGIGSAAVGSTYAFNGTLDVTSQGLENSRVITYGGFTVPELGTISGTVTDGSNLPLAGVSVTVQGYPQNDITDANGLYSLTLTPGSYDLDYAKLGYGPQARTGVVVVDQQITDEDVQMFALPVVTFVDEDFETGAPGWTHDAAAGWVDNWHVSTERALSGTQSYKCGDVATGNYANLCDARLTSPVWSNLPASASLSFAAQIESEISGVYADSAYDGGWVEISVNGGAWTNIVPTPAYDKTFRYRAGGGNPYSGPVPGGRCYAGTITTWTNYTLDLAAYEAQSVQLRFRFGSDAGTNREGWYVDDIIGTGYGDAVPDAPANLTIAVSGTDLVFRWDGTGPLYHLMSAATSDGPYETIAGTTAATTLTIPVPADGTRYYVVVATNGFAVSAPSMPRSLNLR
ncbi:MAG: carboxypeptidase regulatory-like domain-containing protein [bacterium]|nr:carboxypeptidase regulatory-like domain-containing protein [bacterium]